MSREKRIRGAIRVIIHGAARDLAVSPNAVQDAINRHFTLLGDTASQFGGTVEHVSGNERLYLFMEATKTLGAAGAMQSASVRISAMSPDTEPPLTYKFAADFGESFTDERLQHGQVRTFAAGVTIDHVAQMITEVPTGQVWTTQSLVDEAAKFGTVCRVQPVHTNAEVPVVQIKSFMSDVAATTVAHRVRNTDDYVRPRRLNTRFVFTCLLLMAIIFGGWTWVNKNPKAMAQLKKQFSNLTKKQKPATAAKKGEKATAKTPHKPQSSTPPGARPEPGRSVLVNEPTKVAEPVRKNRLEHKLPETDEGEESTTLEPEATEPSPKDLQVDPSELPSGGE